MVNRNLTRWKEVKTNARDGSVILLDRARILDKIYQGNLLLNIVRMPDKKPLSFESALEILECKLAECFSAGNIGHKPGQYNWYLEHFIEYISDLGYHIELTGDEIESVVAHEVRA